MTTCFVVRAKDWSRWKGGATMLFLGMTSLNHFIHSRSCSCPVFPMGFQPLVDSLMQQEIGGEEQANSSFISVAHTVDCDFGRFLLWSDRTCIWLNFALDFFSVKLLRNLLWVLIECAMSWDCGFKYLFALSPSLKAGVMCKLQGKEDFRRSIDFVQKLSRDNQILPPTAKPPEKKAQVSFHTFILCVHSKQG